MLYNFHVKAVGWSYNMKCGNITGLIDKLKSMNEIANCSWFERKWKNNTTRLNIDYMDGRCESVVVTRCSLM